jgi:hypothetical protein
MMIVGGRHLSRHLVDMTGLHGLWRVLLRIALMWVVGGLRDLWLMMGNLRGQRLMVMNRNLWLRGRHGTSRRYELLRVMRHVGGRTCNGGGRVVIRSSRHGDVALD